MTFVIGEPCIDYTDRSCIEECPVDCIYEGERKLYINPVECIDCGACEVACPVEAISADRSADPEFTRDNRRFFEEALPLRAAPIGDPGGSETTGPIGVDTALVAGYPAG